MADKPKPATINDVARLSGVSIKTVSRVLNREPSVRSATRERVVAAVETLNYRPNLSARQLAGRHTFVIGMLYDNPNGDYVMSIQAGSLVACRDEGYHLLIHPCRADTDELLDEVVQLRHQVDGFIVLQPLSDLERLNRLLVDNDTVCVRISQRPFPGFPWVSVGDAEAAEQMTAHLLDLGHRRVGFIIGHPDHGQSRDRLAGYRAALERRGIAYDESLVEQGQFDLDSGYACARRLLSSAARPTAIFASNDAMAMGVLSAARERGLEIPRDLSVAGFDDSPLARHSCPPITTVRQPIEEIARLATELLVAALRSPNQRNDHRHVQADLVRRASTAPPGGSDGVR